MYEISPYGIDLVICNDKVLGDGRLWLNCTKVPDNY